MFKGIRPGIVVIVLVIGLLTIFGGQYMIKHFYLEKPFKEEVLSVEGVQDVEITTVGNAQKVCLTLNQDVELQDTFNQVKELAQNRLKGQIELKIANEHSSVKMKELYKEMHFAIYEGIASGHFTQMADQVKGIAQKNELDRLDVTVDQRNVYLTMVAGSEVFATVIPRLTDDLALARTGMRGGEPQW